MDAAGPVRVPLRPRIALTVGDPAGIGPEIALAALAHPGTSESMDLLVLGPASLRPADVPPWTETGRPRSGPAWLAVEGPASWDMGRAQASCGRAALAALRAGADLAIAGSVDALVTGPVCKEALHLAGERVEGQSELLARWSGAERCEMVAVAGRLRVLLLTRHVPLAAAIRSIRPEGVLEHLRLLDATLRSWGTGTPRLAVAGLNPHAGEDGLFGDEERRLLAPAIERAREQGLDVRGPLSPDSVFLRAARGEFDGVLALYHDQAFIPVKLLAPDEGFTVLAGLPYLRLSPVHGTAFDIAGQGRASPAGLLAALRQAAAWVRAREPELTPTEDAGGGAGAPW